MIWYDVLSGQALLDKENFEYYGSVSNISDFLSSDKMKKPGEEETKLKNAIKSMNENSTDIIMLDPTTVGAISWFKLEINEEETKEIKTVYEELLRYAYDEVNGIEGPTITSLIETKERFRKGSINTKSQLEELFKIGNHNEDQKHEVILGNILRWLLSEWNKMNGTNFSEEQVANWDAISVFVKTYTEFLKTVNINEPPNKNTMIDLLQLLYIRTNEPTLIWTTEKKITNKIKLAFHEDQWKDIIYQEYLNHYESNEK